MEDSGEIIGKRKEERGKRKEERGKREEMRVLLNYSTTQLLYYSIILLITDN